MAQTKKNYQTPELERFLLGECALSASGGGGDVNVNIGDNDFLDGSVDERFI